MSSKDQKTIKQLKKQLKKLNTRIKKMHMEIKELQAVADTNDGRQMAEELQSALTNENWPSSNFSAVQVETASELMGDAEEVEDILEKNG